MRQLIVTAFVSADGVMEAPGGGEDYRHAGWTFNDVEFDEAAYELKGREQEEAPPCCSAAPATSCSHRSDRR
jgi:hypothetical protein